MLAAPLKGCLAKWFLMDKRPRSAPIAFGEEEDWGRKMTGALKWTFSAMRLLRSASSLTPVAAFSAAWTVTSARAALASWKLLMNAWKSNDCKRMEIIKIINYLINNQDYAWEVNWMRWDQLLQPLDYFLICNSYQYRGDKLVEEDDLNATNSQRDRGVDIRHVQVGVSFSCICVVYHVEGKHFLIFYRHSLKREW